MPYFRFGVPAFPILAMLTGQGIWTLAGQFRDRSVGMAWQTLYLSFLFAGAIGTERQWSDSKHLSDSNRPILLDSPVALWAKPETRHWNSQHPPLDVWVRDHVLPGQTIAFGDMGWVPYANPEIRFLDLNGLVSRT